MDAQITKPLSGPYFPFSFANRVILLLVSPSVSTSKSIIRKAINLHGKHRILDGKGAMQVFSGSLPPSLSAPLLASD